MLAPKRILVAERDAQTRGRLTSALRASGYATSEAGTGRDALRAVQMERPDLVLAGVVLPDIGGRDLARVLESNGHSEPVKCVVVAGPGSRCDGHADVGPEHHTVRWTHVDEVVTFVNAMFDLSEDRDPACLSQPLSVGSVRIDPERMSVVVDGKPVELTRKEFHFLHVLALNSERTCTRDELKRLVWGDEAGVIGRTVDVLVSRLRGKLLATTGREVVETVRGIGYRFVA